MVTLWDIVSRDLVSAAFLRDIVSIAAQRGVEVSALLRAAEVPKGALSVADRLVPGVMAERLWAEAVVATGDADLGLHLGAAAHLSSLGLLANVLLHSSNLRNALLKFADYSRLLVHAVSIEVERSRAGVSAVRLVVAPTDNYVRRSPRQPVECTLASVITLARQLVGRALPVVRCDFRHAAPRHPSSHRRVLCPDVRFGRRVDQVHIRSEALDWPIILSDSTELAGHEARVREALHRLADGHEATESVRQAIGLRLHGEAPSIDEVATALGTSIRSLQRTLSDEGTTFRQVLDEVRKELALAHLAAPDVSIAQIALLLGFSEPRAFHRSFKRWTGTTPRRLVAGPQRN